MANLYKNKVVLANGTTLIDLTSDTVTDASHIVSGYIGHLADGSVVTGTGSGGGGSPVWQGDDDYIYLSDTLPAPVEIYVDDDGYLVLDMQPPALNLQTKNVTPLTSSQTVRADTGYDALEQVNVAAMPAGTAGTPTATKGTVANAAVTVTPSVTNSAGYINSGTINGTPVTVTARELVAGNSMYADDSGSWDVADLEELIIEEGTAGTPTATKSAVSNYSVTVTPSVTNAYGWIQGGTKTGTAVNVSASELVSGTVYIDDSGTWDVTTVKYANVPAGTTGTPTATKSAVSNHSVSVTPSVTNSEGYVFGGTKTGTAVSVSASELVSGTLQVTQNGQVDCSNYASVNVIVPSSSGGWLPPSATLVASNDIVVNLSTDTDWDSWTPSTTSHTLRAASSTTTEIYYDLPSDKCAVAVNFCDSDYRYTSSLTGAGVQLHKTWYMATYVNRISTAAEDDAIVFSSSDANVVGYTSASPTTPILVASATGYGFGLASGATFSFGQTAYPNRIYVTRPALYSRCNATYFPTTVASQVDSSASTITFHQRIWAYDITDSMGYALFDYQHGAFWN